MKVKTYKEMNEKIVGILRLGKSAEQYAAQYIEELQDENEKLKARLDKSVELKEPYYVVDNDSGMIRLYYEKVVRYGELYEDIEEAESRLAELKVKK